MRVAVSIGSANYQATNWEQSVEYAVAADRLGVDSIWSAEAWGMEAVTPLAYLAGRTSSLGLGSGIMQISARTPAMTAMTALSMDRISNGRFRLGLGVSGPQVAEGLHGDAFEKPLTRLREYVEIIHAALAGEPVAYDGQRYRLPLPGGEGKALRLAMAPTSRVPIYLATLGPKMLALTGELADGWLGTSFIPEAADQVMPHLLDGARRRGRTLADLDLQVMTTVDVDDDVERVITRHRRGVAFYVGAMGSEGQNFYKNAYERAGWGDVVAEVQSLWLGGNRAAAVAAMPDEFVLATQCIGTPAMVRSRLSALAKVGISTLRIAPIGQGLDEQLHHLEAVLDLAKDVQ